jgi:hypothetical protein
MDGNSFRVKIPEETRRIVGCKRNDEGGLRMQVPQAPILQLSDLELSEAVARAMTYAAWKVRAQEHPDPKLDARNLVQDAVTDTLSGKRVWNKGTRTFYEHLKGSIDSYVYHHYKSVGYRYQQLRKHDFNPEEVDASTATPELEAMGMDAQRTLREFATDEEPTLAPLLDIVFLEGIPLTETKSIARRLGFDPENSAEMQKVYRWIRALKKLCERWEEESNVDYFPAGSHWVLTAQEAQFIQKVLERCAHGLDLQEPEKVVSTILPDLEGEESEKLDWIVRGIRALCHLSNRLGEPCEHPEIDSIPVGFVPGFELNSAPILERNAKFAISPEEYRPLKLLGALCLDGIQLDDYERLTRTLAVDSESSCAQEIVENCINDYQRVCRRWAKSLSQSDSGYLDWTSVKEEDRVVIHSLRKSHPLYELASWIRRQDGERDAALDALSRALRLARLAEKSRVPMWRLLEFPDVKAILEKAQIGREKWTDIVLAALETDGVRLECLQELDIDRMPPTYLIPYLCALDVSDVDRSDCMWECRRAVELARSGSGRR